MKQYISFVIDTNGGVSLQYARSPKNEFLLEFQNSATSYETIEVESETEHFFTADAYLALAKYLLKNLINVYDRSKYVSERIDEEFLHFKKGTRIEKIFKWIEREFLLISVNGLLAA